MGNDAKEALELVQSFCDTWGTGDIDAIMSYLADDAFYHNIPLDPHTGVEAIRGAIEAFSTGVDKIEFRTHHIAAGDGVVMNERTDVFFLGDKTVEIPVMGTFEVNDGKITSWRDYFDLNMFMSQMA